MSVDKILDNVIDDPMAGLMGLAFQFLASTQALPFWQAITSQFTDPVFSFWLQRQLNPASATAVAAGGVFTLGGTNETLFSGEIEFLNLQTSASVPLSFWLLVMASKCSVEQDVICRSQPLSDMTVNGTPVKLSTTNASAAIDTGTTLIGGPSDDVAALYAAIPQSRQSQGTSGFYEFRMYKAFVPYFSILANVLSFSLQYKCCSIVVLWRKVMANQHPRLHPRSKR